MVKDRSFLGFLTCGCSGIFEKNGSLVGLLRRIHFPVVCRCSLFGFQGCSLVFGGRTGRLSSVCVGFSYQHPEHVVSSGLFIGERLLKSTWNLSEISLSKALDLSLRFVFLCVFFYWGATFLELVFLFLGFWKANPSKSRASILPTE